MDAADQGHPQAAEALFAELYSELHQLARRELHRRPSASLGATTLLHEAYLNLTSRNESQFPDRARFLCYASRAMRGLIIDHARNRQAQKRGGCFEITALPVEMLTNPAQDRELSQISASLDDLAKSDPALAQIVDLKFFCGFSFVEIAALLGVNERTIQRRWEKARIYLYRSIRAEL
jgi:RNA polymerase sigma factor (TIGR02999 family)